MPRQVKAYPKYRKYRASGQAIVSLNGQDHYLGPHGARASHLAYDRLILEYLSSDTQAPQPAEPRLSMVGLLVAYWSPARESSDCMSSISGRPSLHRMMRSERLSTPSEKTVPQLRLLGALEVPHGWPLNCSSDLSGASRSTSQPNQSGSRSQASPQPTS